MSSHLMFLSTLEGFYDLYHFILTSNHPECVKSVDDGSRQRGRIRPEQFLEVGETGLGGRSGGGQFLRGVHRPRDVQQQVACSVAIVAARLLEINAHSITRDALFMTRCNIAHETREVEAPPHAAPPSLPDWPNCLSAPESKVNLSRKNIRRALWIFFCVPISSSALLHKREFLGLGNLDYFFRASY
jgi:hypothetical protein